MTETVASGGAPGGGPQMAPVVSRGCAHLAKEGLVSSAEYRGLILFVCIMEVHLAHCRGFREYRNKPFIIIIIIIIIIINFCEPLASHQFFYATNYKIGICG
jgi:hypothetical protein